MQKLDANENNRLMETANAIVDSVWATSAETVNTPVSVGASIGLAGAQVAPALVLAQ